MPCTLALSSTAVAGILSLAALVLAGLVAATGQIYIAVTGRRQAAVTAPTGDNYSRTIEGFTKLLTAQSARIDELEEEVAELRREARSAALHMAECERDLRETRRRLAALEAGS